MEALLHFQTSFADPTPVCTSFLRWLDKVCAEHIGHMHLLEYRVVYWGSVYCLFSTHQTPQIQIVLSVSFHTFLAWKQTMSQVRDFFCKLSLQYVNCSSWWSVYDSKSPHTGMKEINV